MKKLILFMALTLLLSHAAAAQQFDVANTPKPTIEAKYPEMVRVGSAHIEDSSGNTHTVIQRPQSEPNTTYTFQSDDILRNGNYTFFITAIDEVQNQNTSSYNFTVDVPFQIVLVEPKFGYSPNPLYEVILNTTEEAFCSWSFISVGDVYSGRFFDNENPSINSNPYFYSHTHSNSTFDDRTVWFKCLNRQDEQAMQSVYFRVDESEPSINITSNPNPVIDPATRSTNLSITTDDATVCWRDGELIGDSDPLVQSTYRNQRTETIVFDYYDTTPKDFTYDITCQNLAGLNSQQNHTVNVALTNAFVIERVSPNDVTNDQSISLSVRTPITTVCQYRQSSSGSYSSMSTSNNRLHTSSLGGLTEGNYSYDIQCTASTAQEQTTIAFLVDRTAPTNVSIQTSGEQCNLNSLSATFVASDATGISFYNYSISRGSTTVFNWTRSYGDEVSISSIDIIAGDEYTWNMNAVDGAGNKKSASPVKVTPLNETAPNCDEFRPSVQINRSDQPSRGGQVLRVICRDDNSGCASTYNYTIANVDTTCTVGNNTNQLDATIFVDYGMKACFWVSDNNGNTVFREVYVKEKNATAPPPPPEEECGDGRIVPGEACDGYNLNGLACSSFGFTGGTLDCYDDCSFDTTGCAGGVSGACGDGQIGPGESCDSSNLAGLSCTKLGFGSGDLSCDSCKLDTNSCSVSGEEKIPKKEKPEPTKSEGCGNGIINEGEECDGSNLGGKTFCEDIGMSGGMISCTSSCTYDTSACRDDSGDEDIEPEEGGSVLAVIMIILGLLMMFGGGGYLGYKKYYGPGIGGPPSFQGDKPSQGQTQQQPQQPVQQRSQPRKPTLDDVRRREKQKMLERSRRAKKARDRKKLFEEFEVKNEKEADTKEVKDTADEVFGKDKED